MGSIPSNRIKLCVTLILVKIKKVLKFNALRVY